MGRPTDLAAGFKIDLSHQEMERLVTELEETYASQPAEWITADAMGNYLCHTMGYEDMDEFEDALNGTFVEFLHSLPHIETKVDAQGRLVCKVKPEPPLSSWTPTRMTLRVSSTKDLWNVLWKSPHGTVEIPHMEFEISRDGKKHIDSLYNHIGAAIFNLGTYVRSAALSDDHTTKISATIEELNRLLDVEQPWDLVVHDPSGLSTFSNMDAVDVQHVLRDGDESVQAGYVPNNRAGFEAYDEGQLEEAGGVAQAAEVERTAEADLSAEAERSWQEALATAGAAAAAAATAGADAGETDGRGAAGIVGGGHAVIEDRQSGVAAGAGAVTPEMITGSIHQESRREA